MSTSTKWIVHLHRLRGLLLTQRAARLLLRGIWMGLAGYLIAWGMSTRFGLFPDPRLWFGAALLFAAPSLIASFRPLPAARLAWKLDRGLGYREQITTAWQVTQTGQPLTGIASQLQHDAAALLEETRPRLLRRGWFLTRDLEALLILVILLLTVYTVNRLQTSYALPELTPPTLPALAASPSYEDVFPSGIPGLSGPPQAGDQGSPAAGSPGLDPQQAAAIDNILTDLGEALSQQPETAPAGEALQNGDLQGAAAAIDQLADNLDLLPPEARQNAQQALQQAAQQAREAGQDDLAEDLQRAASALENLDPNDPLTADALDQLADALRDLAEQFASMGLPGDEDAAAAPPEDAPQVGSSEGGAGAGTGGGTDGQPEPLSRLAGEGEEIILEGGQEPSGLLSPGEPAAETTTPGSLPPIVSTTDPAAAATNPIDSLLTPYRLPWQRRQVVSEYFR